MEKSSHSILAHIHGIRVLTMAWIILGHTFGLVNHTNYSKLEKESGKKKISKLIIFIILFAHTLVQLTN